MAKVRTRVYGTAIQVWPSGRGYEYRGDVDGPAGQKRLRNNTRCGGKLSRWRAGTAAEWAEVRVQVRAAIYAERDVLACQSGLVSDLCKVEQGEIGEGFSYDEIRNLYPDPSDWDAKRCREWLGDQGVRAVPEDDAPGGDLADLRDLVSENAEAAEVFEWWLVASWLCDQLHAIGEVTIDNGYGHWWGRCCTGQGFLMDGTLQRVAWQFEEGAGDDA